MNQSDPFRTGLLHTWHSLAPERVARPAHVGLVWATLFFAWLISLLPWRVWPSAPDLLLVVITYWCVREPLRVGMFTAFVAGILIDVHDSSLLGEHALTYVLLAYGAIVLHRRLQRFGLISQAVHMLPLFVLAKAVTVVIHAWLAGQWPGWSWLWAALLTAALFPAVGWLLYLPSGATDDGDSPTG